MSISFLFQDKATVDFELVVNIKFDNALNNNSSSQYKDRSTEAKKTVSLKIDCYLFFSLL